MKRKITVALVALLALSVIGCRGITERSYRSESYVFGELRNTLPVTMETAYQASLKTLEDMGTYLISQETNALNSRIVARTQNDSKITINLIRTEAETCKIDIRINKMGNESESREILESIQYNLDTD